MISTAKITQIKEASDIVEVISDFVTLKKRGKNYFGLSPFNNERTPSFTVSPVKSMYKCFSSGKGGDVIDFIMQHLSLPYQEAVGYLAKKYNIDTDAPANYIIPERKPIIELLPSFIPADDVKPTLGNPFDNNLFKFLSARLGADAVAKGFEEYGIGTLKDWCIFWQVDSGGHVRSGKYIKYKPDGHRDKETKTSWHHNATREYKPLYPDFNLQQCLFGEHLICQYPRRPIAIVESEKTAVVASLFIDKYTWLACGGISSLVAAKMDCLRNRSVTLFPDTGSPGKNGDLYIDRLTNEVYCKEHGYWRITNTKIVPPAADQLPDNMRVGNGRPLSTYEKWSAKAKEYGFNISNHIEQISTEDDRLEALDLADFLLRKL